jgi:hypothetical protein
MRPDMESWVIKSAPKRVNPAEGVGIVPSPREIMTLANQHRQQRRTRKNRKASGDTGRGEKMRAGSEC